MKTLFIRRWSGCTVGLLFLILVSASAFAQFEKGAIGGTVTDSTGALVVGAEVKATSVNTGVVRTTVTNDAGIFTLSNLTPDSYDVSVTQKGFVTFKQALTISPGGRSTLDAKLEVGAT